MNDRRRNAAKRRPPTRRWHVPPPLVHGRETLEGGGILNEWSDETAVVLWQGFRDVMLWATTEPVLRAETFASVTLPAQPAVAIDARIDPSLLVLRRMVREPKAVTEDEVARACRQISEWAFQKKRFETALAFAQNAALAGESSAAAAHWVATIAGRLNDHARAEGWFRRAIGLARQGRDWRMYARSFSGLGNLYSRRGNLPAARRLHTRALRGARRGGMRTEQAAALHDLFTVAVDTRNATEAEKLARQALDAFGTRNPRVHILAHDVAYFWMEQGQFARAFAVFEAVLPLVEVELERVFVLANLVRAAGAVGAQSVASEAAAEIDRMIARSDLRFAGGRALLEVARGFLTLGWFDRAEQAALGALGYGTEFRENKVQYAAEELLATIREKSRAAQPVPNRVPLVLGAGDELAVDFVRTLKVVAGAA